MAKHLGFDRTDYGLKALNNKFTDINGYKSLNYLIFEDWFQTILEETW